VHYAKAWPQLKGWPNARHPRHDQPWRQVVLSRDASAVAGIGGLAVPRAVPKFLGDADVIRIGCSFTETSFGIAMPKGKPSSIRRSIPTISTRTSR
jgi:acetolactate synthase-1/2/3 large subunit